MADTQSAPEPSFRETVEQAETAQEAPQEAQSETPDAAPQETPEAAPREVEKVEKVVPLAALHEERNKRKQIQQQFGTLEQRLAHLTSLVQQQQTPQVPIPDKNTDPIGFTVATQEQALQRLNGLEQQLAYQNQQQFQRQQQEQFVNTVRALDNEFTARQPDSPEAIKFLRESRVREYVAAGMDTLTAQQRVVQDEFALCAQAIQDGENPAERAYEIAKARGYLPPQKKLQIQEQGQKAALPTGSAGKGGGKLTLDQLAKMSSDEFAEATKGNNWRKLMGG